MISSPLVDAWGTNIIQAHAEAMVLPEETAPSHKLMRRLAAAMLRTCLGEKRSRRNWVLRAVLVGIVAPKLPGSGRHGVTEALEEARGLFPARIPGVDLGEFQGARDGAGGGEGEVLGLLRRGLLEPLGDALPRVGPPVDEVSLLGPSDGPLRQIQKLFLEPLTPVLQIDLTGVSGGPGGLPVEGESEAVRVVGDGRDGPLQLTGDLVPADAVSVELTELFLVLGGEGSGHGRLTPSRACGDGLPVRG